MIKRKGVLCVVCLIIGVDSFRKVGMKLVVFLTLRLREQGRSRISMVFDSRLSRESWFDVVESSFRDVGADLMFLITLRLRELGRCCGARSGICCGLVSRTPIFLPRPNVPRGRIYGPIAQAKGLQKHVYSKPKKIQSTLIKALFLFASVSAIVSGVLIIDFIITRFGSSGLPSIFISVSVCFI